MSSSDERKRRGHDIIKRYRPISGTDTYAAATDAITDILLFVARNNDEARKVLHSAEVDLSSLLEEEDLISEG